MLTFQDVYDLAVKKFYANEVDPEPDVDGSCAYTTRSAVFEAAAELIVTLADAIAVVTDLMTNQPVPNDTSFVFGDNWIEIAQAYCRELATQLMDDVPEIKAIEWDRIQRDEAGTRRST